MPSHLVISAIAPNRPGIVNEITSLVTYCDCNILESKMKSMGETFCLVLMASGEWNAIAKLEHILPTRASALGMTTMLQRTELVEAKTEIPYRFKIVALDNPGISKDITEFFSLLNVNIQEMSCQTYQSQQSGATIGTIKLTVNIPTPISATQVRESFRKYCTSSNLDGTMEPIIQ